ncbi:U32 family peptidase [Candidatus Falkowbacteria bacterium]|nr:U32 family peptidase [Candidatus Falkowbacteria bacterium]
MSLKPSQAEIMAPVGSYESLAAAINAGADSIYFGVTQLNMRARSAANLTLEDLRKVADTCHQHNIKCYLTVNTLLYDHDLVVMRKIVDAAKANKIDAIIASDFAVLQYCKDTQMPVHISTQLSISNYESVKFFAQFTNRVVLARELTIDQIKDIYKKIEAEQLMGCDGHLMEIECFVHGALCVAQSGRCYMSLYTYGSSANRGACKQNCRAKYKVTDVDTGKELIVDNNYIMSAADICTIDFLDQLLDAGIKVWKIEGRGRSPEYVDTVVRTYKQALKDLEAGTYKQNIESYFDKLKTVYNRGLSHGNFFLGKEIGAYSNIHGSQATQEKEFIGKVFHYFPEPKVVEIVIESGTLSVGDMFSITGATTGVELGEIKELRKDNEPIQKAVKGDRVTFPFDPYIRKNDNMYRIFNRTHFQDDGNH